MFVSDILALWSLILDLKWVYKGIFTPFFSFNENNQLLFQGIRETPRIQLWTYISLSRYLRMIRLLTWIRIFKDLFLKNFALEATIKNKSEDLQYSDSKALHSCSWFYIFKNKVYW